MQKYRNGEWFNGYQETGMVVEYKRVAQGSSFVVMKQFYIFIVVVVTWIYA